MSSDHDNIIDGYKHFKDFYYKLNMLSEITKIDKTGDAKKRKTLVANILMTENIEEIYKNSHTSTQLIKTFKHVKQSEPSYKTVLQVGNAENPITVTISTEPTELEVTQNGVTIKDQLTWFDSSYFNLFNKNIVEFNAKTKSWGHEIQHLFKFKSHYADPNAKYVWDTNIDMVFLFNRPFLLLTFEMNYYNYYGRNFFTPNFDIISQSKKIIQGITIESLIYIEKFASGRRPTFLMLLIYYAGYNFKITKDDIIRKFRNKFSQSSNGMSFEIKSYIQEADSLETKYNNKIRSTIKPTCVNLEVEELLVYHVGGKIESLWDYVNGKLTILINNMLNSKDQVEYTRLFNKQYTSNSLFLFECISELKKYKEYISNLNPENLKAIAYPMSTLKTLEILILKLSYILSILEPTFIPIETMSFDVTIDGKKLNYVINSELQATNIGIDDYISNNKLMAAFISIKDCLIYNDNKSKDILAAMFSRQEDKNIYIKFLQKEADNYRDMSIRKSIDIQRIKQHKDRLVKEKPDDITLEIQTIESRLEKETANLANIRSKVDSAISIIQAIKEKKFTPDMLKKFNEIVVSDLSTEEFHNDDPSKERRQHKHHSGQDSKKHRRHSKKHRRHIPSDRMLNDDKAAKLPP